MIQRGYVTNVVLRRSGGLAVVGALTGAEEVWVDEPYDFRVNGGTINIEDGNGSIYGYSTIDYNPQPLADGFGGVVYGYKITLTTPLAFDVDPQTAVLSEPLGAQKFAYIELDDNTTSNMRVVVPFPMYPMMNEGVREYDARENVVISDEYGRWEIASVTGALPLIPAQYVDLEGSGVVIDPTTPPPASPLPEVLQGSGAAVVRWINSDITTQYDLYVSTDNGVAPGPASLHSLNVHSPTWVTHMPDGTTPIPTDTDVYFALVASNSVGSAPASAWVAGRAGLLNDQVLSASLAVIQQVVAEIVQTQGLQIGDHTWNEVTGLTIPGVVNFPPDAGSASIAQIWAKMIARSLTVENYLSIRGANNEFSVGSVTQLARGVTDPTSGASAAQYWPTQSLVASGSVTYETMSKIAGDRNFAGIRYALVNDNGDKVRIYENGVATAQIYDHGIVTWSRIRDIARGNNCWWIVCIDPTLASNRVYVMKLSNDLSSILAQEQVVFDHMDEVPGEMNPNPTPTSTAGYTASAGASVSYLAGSQAIEVTAVGTGAGGDTFASVNGDAGGMRMGMIAGRTYKIDAYMAGTYHGTSNSTFGDRTSAIVVHHRIGAGAWNVLTTGNNQAVGWRSITFTLPVGTTEAFIRLYHGGNGGSISDTRYTDWKLISLKEVFTPYTFPSDAPENFHIVATDSATLLPNGGEFGLILKNQNSRYHYKEFLYKATSPTEMTPKTTWLPFSDSVIHGALWQASGGTNPYGEAVIYAATTSGVWAEGYRPAQPDIKFIGLETIALANNTYAWSLCWAGAQDNNGAEMVSLFGSAGAIWLNKYSKQVSWTNHEVVYTWYDSDTLGGTHETKASPIYSMPAKMPRTWQLITPPPANDTGNQDAPNCHRIYASNTVGGTKRLQGVTSGPSASFILGPYSAASGTTPPATNSFLTSGITPAEIKSEKTDANGPIISLKGDGSGRVGPLSWDGDGLGLKGKITHAGWASSSPVNGGNIQLGVNSGQVEIAKWSTQAPAGASRVLLSAQVNARCPAGNQAVAYDIWWSGNAGAIWVAVASCYVHNHNDGGQALGCSMTTIIDFPPDLAANQLQFRFLAATGGGAGITYFGMINMHATWLK